MKNITEDMLLEILNEAATYASMASMEVSDKDKAVYEALIGVTHICSLNADKSHTNKECNKAHLELFGDIRDKILNSDLLSKDNKSMNQIIYELTEDFVLGSAKDLNLEKYGYDMVVGVTLGSVNATMKEYVMNMKADPEVKYYVEREKEGRAVIEEANAEEFKELEALHLFDIPDNESERTEEQQQAIEEASNEYFLLFAFKAGFGIPDWVKPSYIKNIIDFDTGEVGNKTKVKYKLFFSSFSIIQMDFNRRLKKTVFSKLEQGEDKPWIFNFNVDLGLVGVNLNDVPEEIRKKIYNIDPGSMFSIQQLFLDLNSTRLQDAPVIEGLSPEALDVINRRFINIYFKRLRELGDIVFSYSVKPATSSTKQYIIKPTDFRFYVSPYYEDGLPNPEKKELYTLNYLVMCDGNPVPNDLKKFDWNWVDKEEYSIINGRMAINKNQMISFAEKIFSPYIQNLLLKPKAYIKNDPSEIIVKMSLDTDDSEKVCFKNGYYFYSKRAYDHDKSTLRADITVEYHNENYIKTYQSKNNEPIIECACNIRSYLRLDHGATKSMGNIYNKTIYFTLKASVDAYGNLNLIPSVEEKNHGSNFDQSNFQKIFDLDVVINNFQKYIETRVDNAKEYVKGNFLKTFNNNILWTLPGNQTFIYKNPIFSSGLDLCCEINYASPRE